MARRFRRSFRRGRTSRPLLRWTSFLDEFTGTLESGQPEASYEGIVVPLTTFKQNEALEGDGCVVKRIVGTFNTLAVLNNDDEQANAGLFMNWAWLVQDVDAPIGGSLLSLDWAQTMVNERVLWWDHQVYTLNAAVGIAGAQAVTNNVADELKPAHKIHFDIRVAAKLHQKLVLKLGSAAEARGPFPDQTLLFNNRVKARLLLGVRF